MSTPPWPCRDGDPSRPLIEVMIPTLNEEAHIRDQGTNLARVLRRLKDSGVWLAGTADGAEKDIYQADLDGPLALVMGSEGKGMRRLTAELCDFLVSIPMQGSVNSLNVSVATGVCLFEINRQRAGK